MLVESCEQEKVEERVKNFTNHVRKPTTPLTGLTSEKMTTSRSPNATVNNQQA